MKCIDVTYNISNLKPVINEADFDLHYNKIYLNHINNYNNSTGDIPYERAGAMLHSLYFENIRENRSNNLPTGLAENIIMTRYGTIDNFVKTLLDTMGRLQGSGWVFMNTSGYLNIIPNNRIVDNIALIIDFYEHAYYRQFGNDKQAYTMNHLNIINWDVVNKRIVKFREKKES